jgi:sugar lactone lactonase YvrE
MKDAPILPIAKKQTFVFYSFFFLCFSFLPQNLFSQWTNGQSAIKVLGQPSFGPTSTGTAAHQMNAPRGVFLDSEGRLWVAEQNNNRVLRFDNPQSKIDGSPADAVLGQANFLSNGAGNGPNQMDSPRGVYVDKNGTLWVSEIDNNRILRFDNAATKPNGANADGILGQANFGTSIAGNGANQLSDPTCLLVDQNGTLWIADRANNRILRFNNAATKPNGSNADGVLGQANFGLNGIGNGANQLNQPDGLALDASGNLWVGDVGNDRILRYNNIATKVNGANADGVLGVNGFGISGGGMAANQVNNPRGLCFDHLNNLYVAETTNDRISIFLNAANKANGAAADLVLGQSSFGVNGAGSNANQISISSTTCMTFDATNKLLWLSDNANNRVIAYQMVEEEPEPDMPSAPIPSLSEWGLIIFGLLILNISVFFVRKVEYQVQ